MLFHVTMTHTEDNCPGYEREKMPQMIEGMEKLAAVEKELGLTVKALLWGAPEHVAFAVIEADRLSAVAQYVNAIPLRQDCKVTAVENLVDVIGTAKAMMARAKANGA